jgi:hypothetical protein
MKPNALSYKETMFVGRTEEIEKIIIILRLLLSGSPPDKRTIAFMGERGIGKSWLLRHLYQKIKNEFQNIVLFQLDLADLGNDPVLAVLDALRKFRACFSNSDRELEGGTPAEASRRILEDAREQIKKRVLVVLVDHVYESDWKLLAGLEDYLLGPLSIEPNTLIILSGRGREYPWKTPELRLKAEFEYLQPLSEDDTKEQLRKQIPENIVDERVKDIFKATGGNPLGNYLLGKEKDPEKGLNAMIEATLEVVPDPEKRKRIRGYLAALCVLRSFDEERIPLMLAAYHPEDAQYTTWKYAESRQVRDELVQGSFARWDEKRGGFVMDEVLRKSLETYLQSAKPETWERLQEKALSLYQGWSKKYPRAKDFWMQEVEYHDTAMKG